MTHHTSIHSHHARTLTRSVRRIAAMFKPRCGNLQISGKIKHRGWELPFWRNVREPDFAGPVNSLHGYI